MKKTFAYLFIVGFIFTLVNAFSFVDAQFFQTARGEKINPEFCSTVTICGTAPQAFSEMLDFVREMINSIKTIGTEGEYLGEYVNPNRFQGNDFVPSEKSLVGKVARNTMQKLTFVTALSAIFSDILDRGGFKEIFGNTVLVAKNEVFLRDNKLVEDMEDMLNDKKYELGMGGKGRYENINDANLLVMNGIIDAYKKKGLLTSSSLIEKGASYADVTSVLGKVLSAMKTFLYLDSTDQFSQKKAGDHLVLYFSPEATQSIEDSYDCARGFLDVCDKNKTTFKTIRKDISTKRKSSSLDNKSVFTDANKRLVALFSKTNDDDIQQNLDDRKYALWRSTYGQAERKEGILFDLIDGDFTQNEGSFGEFTSAVGDVGVGIADAAVMTATGAVKIVEGIIRSRKTIWKPSEKVATTTINVDIPSSDGDFFGDSLYTNILNTSVNDILVHQAVDQELLGYVEVKDITPAFAILGDQISTTKINIIGNKDTDNTLIKSLGEACETQCGRGGSCR